MKKFLGLFIFALFLFVPSSVLALDASESAKVSLSLFYSNGCPHCAKEKDFLEEFSQRHEDVEIKYFEVSNVANTFLFQQVAEKLQADTGGVPFTVVCNDYLVGFRSEETTGVLIEEFIDEAKTNGCVDVVGQIQNGSENEILDTDNDQNLPRNSVDDKVNNETSFSLPFLGMVSAKDLSLPLLTIVVGLLDGFNPCAMWVLLFLISMLLGMKDRKKMWILGGAFIFTSAMMYGFFMTAWLNVFLFIGYVHWVQLLIGIFSLGIGIYYLRDYFINKSGGCTTTSEKQRNSIFTKIKKITHTKQLGLALLGICSLAVAVNIIELVCSAGLPAVYTSILSQSNLLVWQYYVYILLYLLMFMIDDLFIFVVAMVTFKVTGIENKYSRASHLIGGVVMLLIGLAMLFKPELLMMG